MKDFTFNTSNSFCIAGPAGDLELLVNIMSTEGAQCLDFGVICHPHPLHQGTMHNKVVTTVAKAMRKAQINTVQFNFRGVGLSSGVHDYGRGEIDDCMAVINWVIAKWSYARIHLAGFSFGAFIALQAALKNLNINTLITIAPPINLYNFAALDADSLTYPWLIIQGTDDTIVAPQAVMSWSDKLLSKQKKIVLLSDTCHFFHGKLRELEEQVVTFFSKQVD